MKTTFDIAIIYEHPEWHKPLFEALDKRKVSYAKIDLKKAANDFQDIPDAKVYYNLVSPSAYVRGNQRAIPFAFALCRALEFQNKLVINGSKSMLLECSKSSQIALLKSIGIEHPKNNIVFNDVDSLIKYESSFKWPMVLKPEQGGSGAKMYLIYSLDELKALFISQPGLWYPDNLFMLQEKLLYDESFGIVRLEYLEGRLLYAMRVITHGGFNLCPSVVCNPEDGSNGACEVSTLMEKPKPEFIAYKEVPEEAVASGMKIMIASGHLSGSVEYLETLDGRRVFYDINANSNLRDSIGQKFNIAPFEEVVDFLISKSLAA